MSMKLQSHLSIKLVMLHVVERWWATMNVIRIMAKS